MITLRVEYDDDQHITATKEPNHNVVAIDCPYTGKGEEFSPASLLTVSLASCMLLSMGAVARRDGLDLRGSVVDVAFKGMGKRFPHVDVITLVFNIPHDIAPAEQKKLERAAGLCPIMDSLDPDTRIHSRFNFGAAAESRSAEVGRT